MATGKHQPTVYRGHVEKHLGQGMLVVRGRAKSGGGFNIYTHKPWLGDETVGKPATITLDSSGAKVEIHHHADR